MEKRIITKSRNETVSLGERVGKSLKKGFVLALYGSLGSGKTVFAKGVARGLKVKKAHYVNSPTFVILKEYKGRLPLYHFDVYRLKDIDSFKTVGYGDYFYGDGVSVIEWADKIKEALPKEHLLIKIDLLGENERAFKISARGNKYKAILNKLC